MSELSQETIDKWKLEQVQLNREMEDKWRRGEITFTAFNWWLVHICGV
jgi:hypothetical protein